MGGGVGDSWVDMDLLITERTKACVKGQGEGELLYPTGQQPNV